MKKKKKKINNRKKKERRGLAAGLVARGTTADC